jgi:hypothetical protein
MPPLLCFSPRHDREHWPRPRAEYRVTLDNDGQEFDCLGCLLRRIGDMALGDVITIAVLLS